MLDSNMALKEAIFDPIKIRSENDLCLRRFNQTNRKSHSLKNLPYKISFQNGCKKNQKQNLDDKKIGLKLFDSEKKLIKLILIKLKLKIVICFWLV